MAESAPSCRSLARTASPAGRSVLLVGAGAVNPVTARTLLDAGFRVTVVDAAPDSRARRPWREYGCGLH